MTPGKFCATVNSVVLLLFAGALFAQDDPVDLNFNPGSGANDLVESLLVQPDGKIFIFCIFTEFHGQPRNYIARLNSDGSLDATFAARPNSWVRYIALQADDQAFVGG